MLPIKIKGCSPRQHPISGLAIIPRKKKDMVSDFKPFNDICKRHATGMKVRVWLKDASLMVATYCQHKSKWCKAKV